MSIENRLISIDEITELFVQTFGNLRDAQLNFKPDSKTWSIAQNIEHLIVINATYRDIPGSVRNRTYKLPWIGKVNFFANLFGKLILQSVQPDRKRKIKTFPMWEPSYSEISNDILTRFKSAQNDLKKLIRDSDDLVAVGTVISSPASRKVVYKLETAFDIIIAHERRHFEQAKEVLHLLEKKSG
jgi:hypothetical protein